MVATADALATEVGVAVLKAGGNAVDSAAVGFTIAVTLPRAGNLGGGGFMIFAGPATRRTASTRNPRRPPHPNMFLDAAAQSMQKRVRFSHLAVGVPGTVAGLLLALNRWTPFTGGGPGMAIEQPPKGSPCRPPGHQLGGRAAARLGRPAWRRCSSRWRRLSSRRPVSPAGPGGYPAAYRGRRRRRHDGQTATLIAADMRRHGSLITAWPADYRAVRAPITGSYRGYQVEAMPPPSSGGYLVQMLNMLEIFPIARWEQPAGLPCM